MIEMTIPALYALLLWWFSTGIVLYVVRLPDRTHRISLAVAAVLAAAALAVIAVSANDATLASAYLAFTSAILVWGLIELAFLTGHVTGSHRKECPAGVAGFARARLATTAIIYHELALVAGGALIVMVSWGGSNRMALMTYALLWVMRLSAKLNLFLGVPYLQDELLPRQITHLRSYFRRGPMNWLLPFSIVLPLIAGMWLVSAAIAAPAAFATASYMLLAALLALAILEHVFMLLPLPVMEVWNWGHRPKAKPSDGPGMDPISVRPAPDHRISITRRGL
jgi:putative photosynthetic complex assembly protein 2